MNRQIIRRTLFFALLPIAGTASAVSTQPSPEVIALLSKLDKTYASLRSAEFDGHVTGHFDIAGQQKDDDISFTSSFRAPNQFKHDAKGDVVLGSTGLTAYAFQPSHNVYLLADAPKERGSLSNWPRAIPGILQQQNPALLLALSKSAGTGLSELGEGMIRLPDTDLNGTKYSTLQFNLPSDHQVVTMLIDPKTSLLRQVRFDLRRSIEARGSSDVKAADVMVDYTKVATDISFDDQLFAWNPPLGATLASAATAAAADDKSAAMALVGTAAPDFTLPELDDKPVKLSLMKGSVVLLDFWATWCGPCVAALPGVDQLYKDQSANGLKAFAVNQAEDKDTAKAFVSDKKLSLPVLLDSQGDVGKQYKADAIPETVIIGKDGTVKNVFVGSGNEEEIKAAVVKELGN